MRPVIHILDNLAVGGCQTCLRALAAYPNKARRHHFFSLRRQRDEIILPSADTYISPNTSRYALTPFLELRRFVKETGPAILHCHLFKSQVFGLVLRRLRPECRLIFHEGGRIVGSEHEPWWESRLYRHFLRHAEPSVDQFIANSEDTMRHLVQAGVKGRPPGVVVYNSILEKVASTTPEQRRQARAGWGLSTEATVLGFAGRLVERKGWRDFLACALHFQNRPDLHWVIGGSGPEESMLKKMIAESGTTRIHALGFQSDMTAFYQGIDACIVPSHWEPHGLVQIEAQGHGLPVLASQVPGMSETLSHGNSALFFPPADVTAMIRKVEAWLADPALRAQLAQASLENARRFTIKNYHDQLEAVYHRLEKPAP